jgi:glycosyltransferase involved in cell wall biosynthesis/SAM-dependent methyltransferase
VAALAVPTRGATLFATRPAALEPVAETTGQRQAGTHGDAVATNARTNPPGECEYLMNISDFFDQQYDSVTRYWWRGEGRYERDPGAYPTSLLTQMTLRLIKDRPPGRALDIGAGEGADSIRLALLGYDVTAVEISKIGAEKILMFAEQAGVTVNVEAEDIIAYEPDGQFDIVLCNGVLQYVEDKGAVIRLMQAATREDGINVLSLWSTYTPVPECHKLVPVYCDDEDGMVVSSYKDWYTKFIYFERNKSDESHSDMPNHSHSHIKLIARKPLCHSGKHPVLIKRGARSMSGDSGLQSAQERHSPLISIIIPTFNVEDFLPDCLASITQQDFRNIEVIAVDGASSDTTVKILDQASGKDPRLKVVYKGRIGPGLARNEGVQLATGEYIWFVDGDDLISAGSLALVASRIEATRPDVLFIGYEAYYPNGKSEPGDGHHLMGRETPECFTLAEQPWVIDLSMAPWAKIIRREFYLSTGIRFWSDPPHEDVPVSCALLMDAGRLSILNQVCYIYKKYRAGSATSTGAPKRHFRIFSSYEAMLDLAGKRASNGDQLVTEEVLNALFQRAIWHYTAIFDAGGLSSGPVRANRLIGRRDRREFFAKMHGDYVHYAPPGYKRPPGARGIKYRLVETNSYRTYSILDPLNKLRMKIDKGIRFAHRAPR